MSALSKLKNLADKLGCDLEIDREEKTVELFSPSGMIFVGNTCSRICAGTDVGFSITPCYQEVLDIAIDGVDYVDDDGSYWWSGEQAQ